MTEETLKIIDERTIKLKEAIQNLVLKRNELDHQIMRVQGALAEIESLKQQVKQQKKEKISK